MRFTKKLAVLPSLCREEFYVLDKGGFLIAPVDPPLQEIVFSQVSHFALSPFLDRRKQPHTGFSLLKRLNSIS